MIVSPYVFKSKAVRALKGNWQTALLVSFFASLPLTVVQLLQATRLPDLSQFLTWEAASAAVNAIPQSTWVLLGVASGLSLVLTPVLAVGCNYYFIRRLHGEEPGFGGLFARMGSAWKALLLYLLIYVKTFLWALLFIIPGIVAALRYAMAPYYLAENPDIGVLEALRKSKESMRTHKGTLLMLELSFVVWLLGAMLCETLLAGLSVILALVVSQFIQLAMATYLNAACASFFLAVSVPEGFARAQSEAAQWLRGAGLGGTYRRAFGNDEPADSGPDYGGAEETADGDAADTGADEGETLGGEDTRKPGAKPGEGKPDEGGNAGGDSRQG